MKTILLLVFYLLSISSVFAQENNNVTLLSYFKEISVPFNTNNYNRFIEKELPYDLALKHIFRGDTFSSRYFYELYSDDDNTITESGYKFYRILPIDYFKLNSAHFITYYKGSVDGASGCFLSILDKNGIQSDSLMIYKEDNENELWNWIRAIILKDSVIVFQYTLNRNKQAKINKEITEIKVYHYSISSQERNFQLVNEETFKSQFYVNELFAAKNNEIKKEDPFYKY